ncbi:hypothetical protein [Hymenobacter sp. DG01]|uniref:hypothetical protein n=1 Tax=Hymenobacter sp. DG01 TaxID=2584940 RepID=UPI0011242511|nr:hypothetical protein [Hymenobacter sp. DG01]
MLNTATSAPETQPFTQQAYALGREAQQGGMMEVPAQDANLWPLLQGLQVGQGLPVLQAWQQGYRHQQDEHQIREFADQLGRAEEVNQLMQAGLTDAARAGLWWQLFNQLPDAA